MEELWCRISSLRRYSLLKPKGLGLLLMYLWLYLLFLLFFWLLILHLILLLHGSRISSVVQALGSLVVGVVVVQICNPMVQLVLLMVVLDPNSLPFILFLFNSNSTQSNQNSTVSTSSSNATVAGSRSANSEAPTVNNHPPIAPNQTRTGGVRDKFESMKTNQTTIRTPPSQSVSNQTTQTKPKQSSETLKNATQSGAKSSSGIPKSMPENSNGSANSTSSVVNKGGNNGTNTGRLAKPGIEDLVKNLSNCNLFDGNWVRDESYPLYKPGSCSLIDEQFNCFVNGRPDKGFQMLKWKPKACTLPRLDGSRMLQLLRGKRLVFVGDSLNRNMWESLICILRNSIKDQTKVYEASGRHHFRSEPSYSFVFKDYDCTVEFFVAPFIVRESETKDKNGAKKETLRLDLIGTSADQYKNADIVVFNTGHWWTHEKTAKGKDYYQEGSHVYGELNVLEAFRKAMTTWGRWVDANINRSKSLVFFRGYSASHFRGGQWNYRTMM
ncbi:unnamed protein product [Lactuca virosa]|uniref:Trichome birefringence-like N-terminal domain-containing protein n=1 Tax=Lactuca virosa TaxID=75947 RepID=A0AAU9P999_9ASTR|nr:unnamed protein product [Lactuca virosa]